MSFLESPFLSFLITNVRHVTHVMSCHVINTENGRLMGGWVSVLLSTPKMSGWLEAGFQFYFLHLKYQAGGRLGFSFTLNT